MGGRYLFAFYLNPSHYKKNTGTVTEKITALWNMCLVWYGMKESRLSRYSEKMNNTLWIKCSSFGNQVPSKMITAAWELYPLRANKTCLGYSNASTWKLYTGDKFLTLFMLKRKSGALPAQSSLCSQWLFQRNHLCYKKSLCQTLIVSWNANAQTRSHQHTDISIDASGPVIFPFLLLALTFSIFICLKVKGTHREKKRSRKKKRGLSPPLVHSWDGDNRQGCSRLKPGALSGSLTQVTGSQDLGHLLLFLHPL